MTNEGRLRNGDISYVLRSSMSKSTSSKEAFKEEDVQNEELKQKKSVISTPLTPAIIRMLDSLKFSRRVADGTSDNRKLTLISSWREKQSKGYEDKLGRFPTDTVSGTRESCATSSSRDSSPDTSKRNDSASDSFSDSTYSQFSDISSDMRSQRSINTTSTDSENNRFFREAIQASNDAHREQLTGASGVTDDDEVEARKVLMLMKVILYLRQNYTTISIYCPRIMTTPQREGKANVSRTLCHRTSSKTVASSQARKRISFCPVTLLFSAIAEKSYGEAKAILDTENVDVNTQSPSGQSLLHIAAGNADLKCMELLLQSGSQVNIKDSNGWAPLHAAIRRGNWKSAIVLIEAGADIAEYAQNRIQEYKRVLEKSRNCYRADEIFV